MSKSSDKNPILTENNDRIQGRKRRRSSSPDVIDDSSPRCLKGTGASKRWKGATSSEFQPELLEEMGVSMLPEASEEDKPETKTFISSSEDNENIDSKLSSKKKLLKKKKKLKRSPLKYIKDNEKSLTNNNMHPKKIETNVSNCEKQNLSEIVLETDSDENSDDCYVDESCEDSASKENSKNLKWEKLKPVNCKIRNSKIIYQNETTLIDESKGEKNLNKNKVEQVRKSKIDRKNQDDDDGDFFLCRRPKIEVIAGDDHFKKLSDEVILSVLRWLPKKSLVNCAMVCKRFYRLAYDEALWARMDLGGRNLPPKSVGYIVSRGFRILRLAQADLPDPVYCPKSTILPQDFDCKLQYLDLSMATISVTGLASFLKFCKHLKKLSLEHCHLNSDCTAAIAQNTELEVLNLTMCIGLTTSGLETILTNCRRLQSLNISWTGLSVASLEMFACKVPSKLERLNISGCRKNLSNEHVIEIFHRCENLIELDVSDCIELTDQVINFIVKYVKKIEYLSFSRCYSINTASFLLLRQVESLMYLDVFGLMTEEEIVELKSGFADVAINQFRFSSVARPTVGIRRTSIWGLRVRD